MEKKPLFQKWKTGLGKTRTGLLARLFASKDGINEAFYEELEEALILADAGAAVTEHLLDDLQVVIKEQKITDRAGAKTGACGADCQGGDHEKAVFGGCGRGGAAHRRRQRRR